MPIPRATYASLATILAAIMKVYPAASFERSEETDVDDLIKIDDAVYVQVGPHYMAVNRASGEGADQCFKHWPQRVRLSNSLAQIIADIGEAQAEANQTVKG